MMRKYLFFNENKKKSFVETSWFNFIKFTCRYLDSFEIIITFVTSFYQLYDVVDKHINIIDCIKHSIFYAEYQIKWKVSLTFEELAADFDYFCNIKI